MALVFDELDFSDEGIYCCKAESDGKEAFQNVTLTVKCKFLLLLQKTSYIRHYNNIVTHCLPFFKLGFLLQ